MKVSTEQTKHTTQKNDLVVLRNKKENQKKC